VSEPFFAPTGHSRVFNVQILANFLQTASRSCVLVTQGRGYSGCTGFFVLPDTIVIPYYALQENESAPLLATSEALGSLNVVSREFIGHGLLSGNALRWRRNQPLLALLRLEERVGVSLPFAFSTVRSGDFIALLQYPNAMPIQAISFGELTGSDEGVLTYVAETERGSGGAPILDNDLSVIGMHYATTGSRVCEGIARATLIDALRHSSSWAEIKELHQIADVAAAVATTLEVEPSKPNDVIVRAALRASIDPASLSDADAEALRPYVVDPSASTWVMRPGERSRAIATVGSLAELRRYTTDEKSDEPTQRVIDRILIGPPYDLDALSEDELSRWIQATRWFADKTPELPTPAQVSRVLERKRVRSRLAVIAGKDFRGRDKELGALRDWWKESKVALSVSGIGGIGKSALVARFASELPANTLLLWLDFDRADLAPDDAASVLAELVRQAEVQLDGFSAQGIILDESAADAKAFGARLRQAVRGGALLVLDSFEAAQYSERYQDLWPVLDLIASEVPQLRRIVTGRAPVPMLEAKLLAEGRKPIHLTGLQKEDAEQWLREHDVRDRDILDAVLDLARGMPLILRLALQLLEKGGEVEDLPNDLPREMIAGFLYGRILNRVQNGELKPFATAALVLRRVTLPLMTVVGGAVGLAEDKLAQWFNDLSREVSLVEGTQVLRLRAEVRIPSLRLLERDQRTFVETIDAEAEEWYAKAIRESDDPELVAELIYHRLRRNNVKGAAEVWRDGIARFFVDVGDELPTESRDWLFARLGATVATPLGAEEAQEVRSASAASVAEQVRDARSRGLNDVVKSILSKPSRGYASELVFHEAYEQWKAGDLAGAAATLDDAGDAPALIGRDRDLLRAMLHSESGNTFEATELLARHEREESWSDRDKPHVYMTAVRAARINLFVDIEAEKRVLESDRFDDLRTFDVLFPDLRRRLAEGRVQLGAVATISLDINHPKTIGAYIGRLNDERIIDEATLTGQLLRRAQRRWRLATSGSFLPDAYQLTESSQLTAVALSILGTAALFSWPIDREIEVATIYGPNGLFFDAISRVMRYPLVKWSMDELPFGMHQSSVKPLNQLLHELAGFISEAT
jgi:trypsin-like peptidase